LKFFPSPRERKKINLKYIQVVRSLFEQETSAASTEDEKASLNKHTLPFTMPGPKMGPRPADFDEEVIRQSPTFLRWTQLETSQKLRYACREFVKDHGDDEERLMRRIMIARRNNIRDHETLKRARRQTKTTTPGGSGSSTGTAEAAAAAAASKAAANIASAAAAAAAAAEESNRRSRRPPSSFSDSQVEKEMDAPAVAATRSYRSWLGLQDGAEFVYNQKYIKGRDGHDWLLRKNIWRRMRYRRENKKMVERLKDAGELEMPQSAHQQQQKQEQGLMAGADQMLVPGEDGEHPGAPGNFTLKQEPMDIADDTKDGITASDSNNNDHNDTTMDDDNDVTNDDMATHAAAAAAATGDHLADLDAVEAAVAAAETFGKSAGMDMVSHVNNPLEAAVAQAAALDAAAQLAAASHQSLDEEGLPREDIEHEASV
jgi:hypothetical protein